MPGWNLKNGKLCEFQISEDEYWSLFNFVFSDACMKRNTYKFGLIKAILDNLLNCTQEDSGKYNLSYDEIFEKFTINYWNLVLKYHLKQMRSDGRTEISKIESILLTACNENDLLETLDFDALPEHVRCNVVKQVSVACRKNVIGALYNDMDGKLYGFDLNGNGIILADAAYNFMLKYKMELEKLNYYAWAKFMEKINEDDVLTRVLDKLELSTPKREDLSVYREILYKEFEEANCFYCGKKLNFIGKKTHVDHFIPWSFVKSDNLWNFVLSCSKCNEKKSNKLPNEEYLRRLIKRNEKMKNIDNKFTKIQFENYNSQQFERMWKYAQLSGMKLFVNELKL